MTDLSMLSSCLSNLVKEHEGAEDDRLVDAVELSFQRAQAECVTVTGNGFIDEQSGRGGTNASRL